MSWKSVKLGDLYEVHNGLSKGRESFGSGYPFLSFSVVFNNYFLPSELTDLVQSTPMEQRSYSIHRGDVFITRTSETYDELGMSCVALRDYPHATYNGFTKRMRPTSDQVLPEYIGYYLRLPSFRAKFRAFATTLTTRASLRNEDLLGLDVMLPDLPTQRRIASILSAYDDLIENNRRQIKILEEAAQRLYREWFVELRFPGYEGVKLVDGVPEGWTVTAASEVTNVLRRGISPNYDDTARLSVISQKCIRQYMVDMNQVRRQSKSFDSSMGLLDSDTVICSTGTGTLGRVGKVFGNHPNCTFDSHVTLVRTNGTVGKHYLNLRMYELREYFDSCKTGSTNQTELSRSVVQNVKVYIADSYTQETFEKIEEAYHKKMMICRHQIQLLTETRDRLLPKLMNGEMEVSE